jgi:hypothetical protein
MSEDDAKAFGLPEDRKSRSAHSRLDDAKQNYSGIGDACWYERALYRLGNGETVPAMVPWQPPEMWAAVNVSVANAALDDIDAGIDGGKRQYTENNAATDRTAWPVVQRHVPSLTEHQLLLFPRRGRGIMIPQ